jgi:hypothetical protein
MLQLAIKAAVSGIVIVLASTVALYLAMTWSLARLGLPL